MKKTGTETKIIVDITSAKNITDVYAAFAIAKFNKLNEVEKDLLRKIIVGNYFNELYDYCDSIDCENCEIEGIDGTIKISAKKPNIFKRIWNKLFKRNKA